MAAARQIRLAVVSPRQRGRQRPHHRTSEYLPQVWHSQLSGGVGKPLSRPIQDDGGKPELGTRQVRPGATGGGHGLAEPAIPPLTRDGTAAESALVVEHLGKRFGDRVAFDDVSFESGYGEVFGFLGPNGAGQPGLGK
jgi:ABC-type glutathione transport system ATPase component